MMAERQDGASADGTEKKPSGSDFIRSLPLDMPVDDVMKQAKAEGLEFSADLVRKVRQRMNEGGPVQSRGRRGGPGRPKKSGGEGAKGAATTKKPGAKGPSKSDEPLRPTESKAAFILSFPVSTPASEIVAAGKAQKLKFSPSYVYYVRGAGQRRKTGAGPGRPRKSSTTAGSMGAPSAAVRQSQARAGDDDAAFFDLVVRVGLTRAEQLLGQVKVRLRQMVGG